MLEPESKTPDGNAEVCGTEFPPAVKETEYTELFSELKLIEVQEPRGYGFDMLGETYGYYRPANDSLAAFDDRYFQRSAMRFSPYFDRIRNARSNAELYTKFGIFPERYCEEFPLFGGDREIYCETVMRVCPEYKKLILNCGIEITIYSEDNSVYLCNVSNEIPEMFLVQNSFLTTVDTPYFDYYVSKGLEPEIIERTVRIRYFEDTLTKDGGSFSLCYEIICFGSVISVTGLDLKLIKLEKPESESYERTVDYIPEETNKQSNQ